MIAFLTGTVLAIRGTEVTLDVQGVGYQVFCSRGAVESLVLSEKAALVIYTDVNENAIRLYGFADELEKQVFLLLVHRVKGVGTRTALGIVSSVGKRELLKIIGAGDLARLQTIRGIGKKTAERIVVELREKVGEYIVEAHETGLPVERIVVAPEEDGVQALLVLGFPRPDATRAIAAARAEQPNADTGELVRRALQHI